MTKQQTLFGAMLATTVAVASLAGCAVPAQTGLKAPAAGEAKVGAPAAISPIAPKTGGSATAPAAGALSQPKQQAASDAGQETAQALADEQEVENYSMLADSAESGAMYAVLVLGQPAPKAGEVAITATLGASGSVSVEKTLKPGARIEAAKAGAAKAKAAVKTKLKTDVKAKVEERRKLLQAKVKARLDKMKDAKNALAKAMKGAKWVDNGDGTKTKTVEFSVTRTQNGKTFERTAKMIRTINADNVVVSFHEELSQALPNGDIHKLVRDKNLQEDGSYHVVFHREMTFKNGTVRTADWDKTIAADGKVTGTGTIVWTKDGQEVKNVKITLNGTEEAVKASAEDSASKVTAEVTATAEGTVQATASDAESGTSASVEVKVETESDSSAAATTTATASTDAAAKTDATATASSTATASADAAASATAAASGT